MQSLPYEKEISFLKLFWMNLELELGGLKLDDL